MSFILKSTVIMLEAASSIDALPTFRPTHAHLTHVSQLRQQGKGKDTRFNDSI